MDLEAGLRAADEAIERAGRNAYVEWNRAVVGAVMRIAEAGWTTFTTDDVWATIPPSIRTHEPRALGSVMRKLQEAGIIEATGEWRPTARPEAHGRPIRVWRCRIP